MRWKILILIASMATSINTHGEQPATDAPAPYGAIPSGRQLNWHELEFYGFLHFTVNTFTGKEWGYGDEPESIFNPSDLDARQWARVARDAGMKGLIITAKHHDGFCLWPSEYTEHSVKNSPWRDGKGDVLQELSEACREYGLKMGVYLSPWDRNHAKYGTPEYVEYYRLQLRELLTAYGDIFEVWHDGANGGDGYYGGSETTRTIDNETYYDWPTTWALVRELQPDAIIFSDAGPDIRWVGNEHGEAPETCWAAINPEGIYPGHADVDRLAHGNPDGSVWRPAEVDVSIRKGWFFHDNESPKSVQDLLDIYYKSVGRGACLLLNLTPDKRGLIPEADVQRMQEFSTILEETFETDLALGKAAVASNVRGASFAYGPGNLTDGDRNSFWATDDGIHSAVVAIDLGEPTLFNRLRVQEHIPLGQRIAAFRVEAHTRDGWQTITTGTTIGARRILRFNTVHADQVRLIIENSLAPPMLSTVELYLASSEPLVQKQ